MARYSPNFGYKSKLWLKWVKSVISRRILTCVAVYPAQKGVTAQKGIAANQIAQRPFVSQNGVEQPTHSGDESSLCFVIKT